jgi:predicted MPP superfamily phosphohydrolase
MTILIAGTLFVLLVDLLFYLSSRPFFRRRRGARRVYWGVSLLFVLGVACYHVTMRRVTSGEAYFWAGRGIFLLLLYYVPRALYLVALAPFLLTRWRRAARRVAAVVASLGFLVLLHGMTIGRYRYEVVEVTVEIPGLPPAFNGTRVVQLSDLHLGSHGKSYPGIRRMVGIVNDLHPDLVVITGDVVNNFASEIEPWIEELRAIEAPLGKFAVTGNHDHGDYTRWPSPAAKRENLSRFTRDMEACGFRVLNNAGTPLAAGRDTLYLCGVENWRKPPLPSYGDLRKALQGTGGHVVVLLSHDPSHWREEVVHHPVALTLSGHTHAMQAGIRAGSFRWSPARYFFPEYNGLYARDGKQIYVSRGAGHVGIPGRFGERPEITLLHLVNTVK